MFGFIADSIENALDVVSGVDRFMAGGEGPTKRQVAKLIADGLTVYAAAEVLGVGAQVVERLLED